LNPNAKLVKEAAKKTNLANAKKRKEAKKGCSASLSKD
jgi:hypothetical protein